MDGDTTGPRLPLLQRPSAAGSRRPWGWAKHGALRIGNLCRLLGTVTESRIGCDWGGIMARPLLHLLRIAGVEGRLLLLLLFEPFPEPLPKRRHSRVGLHLRRLTGLTRAGLSSVGCTCLATTQT